MRPAKITILAGFLLLAGSSHATPASEPQILVQFDQEPGTFTHFVLSTEVFARMPVFTLYDNGFLVHLTSDSVMAVQLSREEARRIRDHVLELGFMSLPAMHRAPVMDVGLSKMRVRVPSDEVREVQYTLYSEPRDVSDSIETFLFGYHHPEEVPYIPERSTLVISANRVWHPNPSQPIKDPDWPLSADMMLPPMEGTIEWAFILNRVDYGKVRAQIGSRMHSIFQAKEGLRQVLVRPWLPGEDYEKEVLSSGTFPRR